MYFGSVKFFKNLILAVVILAIGTASAFAIYYHHQWVQTRPADGDDAFASHTYSAVDSDVIDYQSLYPDFYAPQPYHATQRQSGMIYLTFDGTPSSYTTDILAILKEKKVKATFFLSGSIENLDTETLNAIMADGHTIGMGSCSGDFQALYSSVASYLTDLYQLFTYIKETTGVTPSVFRFPGGSVNSYNATLYQELIAEMIRRGFVPYDWNIDLADMNGSYSTQTVLDTTMARLSTMDRAILLLRSDASAVEVLPLLIDNLSDQRFTCSPLKNDVKPVLFAYPQ